MRRLIDSTDDFEAYKEALMVATLSSSKTYNKHKDVAESTRLGTPVRFTNLKNWNIVSLVRPIEDMQIKEQPKQQKKIKTGGRTLIILGLFGFLMAWAALAIYGAIKIMEKIGWM